MSFYQNETMWEVGPERLDFQTKYVGAESALALAATPPIGVPGNCTHLPQD